MSNNSNLKKITGVIAVVALLSICTNVYQKSESDKNIKPSTINEVGKRTVKTNNEFACDIVADEFMTINTISPYTDLDTFQANLSTAFKKYLFINSIKDKINGVEKCDSLVKTADQFGEFSYEFNGESKKLKDIKNPFNKFEDIKVESEIGKQFATDRSKETLLKDVRDKPFNKFFPQ
jgi:hypothetical protein